MCQPAASMGSLRMVQAKKKKKKISNMASAGSTKGSFACDTPYQLMYQVRSS